ncbi:hypothetical protein Unana1_08441 [Umbelopsis nana]
MSGNKSKKQDHSAELLDFPSRAETIAKLLSDTSKSLQQPSAEQSPTIPPPEMKKTYKVPVKSDLMARLQTFLPEIENANKQLSEQVSIDPKQVDIENVDEDGQFIEMNLGLGVFEEKKPSGSSDDESDVDESDIIINPFAKEKPETKPGITLLDHDESSEEDSDSSSDEEES